MKCFLINLFVFVNVVHSDTTKRLFMPQLPIGEFRVKMIAILRCELNQSNNLIKFNYYVSKTSINTTEVKGNVSYYVPLDDSLNVEVNLAVKDSIGGWKDNAHIFKTPKACSSFKNMLGKNWHDILKHLGMDNVHGCPIPTGCYVASDMNPDNLLHYMPKQFFYGTYKFHFQFTKNKDEYRVKMLAILSCEQSQSNNLIKFNYYTSKASMNTTEMNGNVTVIVQFNDSLNI